MSLWLYSIMRRVLSSTNIDDWIDVYVKSENLDSKQHWCQIFWYWYFFDIFCFFQDNSCRSTKCTSQNVQFRVKSFIIQSFFDFIIQSFCRLSNLFSFHSIFIIQLWITSVLWIKFSIKLEIVDRMLVFDFLVFRKNDQHFCWSLFLWIYWLFLHCAFHNFHSNQSTFWNFCSFFFFSISHLITSR